MNAFRARSMGVGLLTSVMLFGAMPAFAQDGQAGSAETVVPPTEDPLGVPYGEWADRWWEWLVAIPAAENPFLGGECAAGQGGDVFFLPHTLPGSTVALDCAVGADQWILAAPGSVIWTNDDGETFEEMVPLVEGERGSFSNLSLTINGTEVADIDDFWVVGPGIHLVLGEDNIFGGEPGAEYDAVVGGWFVMIPPLAPGSHTIVVRDDVDMGDGSGPQTAEFTANVTVEG